MSLKLTLCGFAALLLSACGDVALSGSEKSGIVETSYTVEAQKAGTKKFGSDLSFVTMYENKEAVCGDVKKGEDELQQFIYVRKHFLLQELSPAGEWEAQWFSECYDG